MISAIIFKIVRLIERCWLGLCRRLYQKMMIAYCKDRNVNFNKQAIRFDGYSILQFHQESKITLGEHFRCVSTKHMGMENSTCSKICVYEGGNLTIGHHSGMTNSTINCHESITIGHHVNIGAGCLIFDSDFHSLNWRDRLDGSDITKKKNAPVIIKDLAFIGTRSIILKGVTIGEKSIIGAGSVVTNNVPDGEIWAGNPARFIKKINN